MAEPAVQGELGSGELVCPALTAGLGLHRVFPAHWLLDIAAVSVGKSEPCHSHHVTSDEQLVSFSARSCRRGGVMSIKGALCMQAQHGAASQSMLANFTVTELSGGQPASSRPWRKKCAALWGPVLATPLPLIIFSESFLLIPRAVGVGHFTGRVESSRAANKFAVTPLTKAGTRTANARPRAPFPPS